jgi:hypothetical protein
MRKQYFNTLKLFFCMSLGLLALVGCAYLPSPGPQILDMKSDASQVSEGGTYRYTIAFKNTSDVIFDEVILRMYYDIDMHIVSVDPKPLTIARATPETPARVEWALGTLRPDRIGTVTLEFQVAQHIDPAKHALNSYSTIEGVSRRGEKIYNASLPHGLNMLGRATPTHAVDDKMHLAATVIYKADAAVATLEASQSLQPVEPIAQVQDIPETQVVEVVIVATADEHARFRGDSFNATAAAPDKRNLQIVATTAPTPTQPVQPANQVGNNVPRTQSESVSPAQIATSPFVAGASDIAAPTLDVVAALIPVVLGAIAILVAVSLLLMVVSRRRSHTLFSGDIEPVIKGSAGYSNLHRQLCDYFDDDELATLCFQMGIDYRHLRGEGKVAKARELILFMHRRGRIGELASMCRSERPNAQWA